MNTSWLKQAMLALSLAFAFDVVWENAQAPLYVAYKGRAITEFILLRASVVDALILGALFVLFLFVPRINTYRWLVIPAAVLISISIEMFALRTGRWSYADAMPIIPILNVGLTPTVQLGLIGFIIHKFLPNPRIADPAKIVLTSSPSDAV